MSVRHLFQHMAPMSSVLLSGEDDWDREVLKKLPNLRAYCNELGILTISPKMIVDMLLTVMADTYKFEPNMKVWFHFDGMHWIEENGMLGLISNALFEIKERYDCPTPYILGLKKINTIQFTSDVVRLLQGTKAIFVNIDDFDKKPDLLNTPIGTYILGTGERYTNRASDLLRHITSVSPQDDEDGIHCPNYIKHLKFMSENDTEKQVFLERISGYCITGYMFTQEFYWFYGIAANGKSSLVQIWLHILHMYGYVASPDHFAFKFQQAHPEQDMRLAGKRLVVSEELRASRWDESKIKTVVSGGMISAREMHGKSVNFFPQCKLIFTSNNKPDTDGGDGGFARRLNMIGFAKQIPIEDRIPDFDKRCLQPEAPYILNRMIKYAGEVIRAMKIPKPMSVELATRSYLLDNNVVEVFIGDQCETNQYISETIKNLCLALEAYCLDNGYEVMTRKKIGVLFEKLGYTKDRNVRLGLRLKPEVLKTLEIRNTNY